MRREEVRQVDVCVVGAGAAGVAAAVTASAAGAEVLCIEKNLFPGGNATAAAVGTVCGIYPRGTTTLIESEFLHSFIPRLQKGSQSLPLVQKEGISFLPYSIPAFTQCCYDLLPDDVLLPDAVITDIVIEDDHIQSLTCMSGETPMVIHPTSIIDASGNAVVSRFADIPCLDNEPHQAAALVFSLTGLPELDERGIVVLLLKTLESAVRDGRLQAENSLISIVPGSFANNTALFKRACAYDGLLTPQKRAVLEREARSGIVDLLTQLRQEVDFESCKLSWIAPSLGIRSGYRGVGQSVLTETDVTDAIQSPKEIVRGVWPLEYWSHRRRPEMIFFPEQAHYSITPSMLSSLHCKNLFFAGRTISGTERAMGSARVLGTAMLTGEASASLALEYLKTEGVV